MMLKVRIHA